MFSLKENFDTSTPMGELMLIQAMSFAQFERQTIVDRVKRGARARAERGLAHGCVPLGFKLVEHRPNYREVDESEKVYVEFVFQKYLALKRINGLVTYLNENGYRTKEFVSKSGKKIGGHRWTLSSVHALLTNRCYIGEREVNKKFRTSKPEDILEDERYFYVQAHWPALISTDLFIDVQRLLEGNKKKARRYTHDYRLTGLIECAECGAPLVGKSGTSKNGRYFYYGHKRKMLVSGNRHLMRCRFENVPAALLEEAIVSRMKDLSSDRALVAELVRATATQSQVNVEHQKGLISAKEQERRKLEQKVNNLFEAISDESDRVLRSGLSNLAKETKTLLDQVTVGLLELKADSERNSNVVDIAEAMNHMRIFREGAFDAQPVAVQAEILKSRIRRIVVRENGVYVEVFGRTPEQVLQRLGGIGEKENPTGAPRSNLSEIRTAFKLVHPARFERTTFAFGGQRSIQLSYGCLTLP